MGQSEGTTDQLYDPNFFNVDHRDNRRSNSNRTTASSNSLSGNVSLSTGCGTDVEDNDIMTSCSWRKRRVEDSRSRGADEFTSISSDIGGAYLSDSKSVSGESLDQKS